MLRGNMWWKPPWLKCPAPRCAQSTVRQGLTLVHFSAQRKRFLWDRGYV